MMYPGNPMGWGNSVWLWWMPMGLMMLLFWGVVIVALILLVRWLRTQGHARAEAQKEEFDRIKKDIA